MYVYLRSKYFSTLVTNFIHSYLCHELSFLPESKACIAKLSYTELEINYPILSL